MRRNDTISSNMRLTLGGVQGRNSLPIVENALVRDER